MSIGETDQSDYELQDTTSKEQQFGISRQETEKMKRRIQTHTLPVIIPFFFYFFYSYFYDFI